MDKTLSRLISRLERLEAQAVLSSKQYPEWTRTREGALIVLRTIVSMRWLALGDAALTLAIQAQVMARIVATDCIEAANELAGELLAPWRQADVRQSPPMEETS
jgi:hypothetical protein